MSSALLHRARRLIDESRQFRTALEQEEKDLENQVKKATERLEEVRAVLRELPLPGGQVTLNLEDAEEVGVRLPPDLSDAALTAPEVVIRALRFLGGWATASAIFKVARDGGYQGENNDLLYSAISRMSKPEDGRIQFSGDPGKRTYRLPPREGDA